MLQFLSESAIITLIGGVVGILLGIGGAFGVAKAVSYTHLDVYKRQGLNSVGLKTAEMEGILITHEHSDHISGLGVIARRYGLPIYGTKGTDVYKRQIFILCRPATFISPSMSVNISKPENI